MIVPCRELMPIIRAAFERGQRVRLTVNSGSMEPFIRAGDVVEIEPARGLPALGTMALVRDPGEAERYVLHRVVRRDGAEIFLRGDAQEQWDGPFTAGDVLGTVVVSYRDGRRRAWDRGLWRLAGVIWSRYRPLGRWLLLLSVRVRACPRGVRRRLQQAWFFRV